jgi:hypothetical protein
MPLYDYLNTETGLIEEHFRTWQNRDSVPPYLVRQAVSRIYGHRKLDNPSDVDQAMPRALRELECNQPSQHFDKFEREHGFSKDHLKRVWSKEWTSTVP